MTVIQSPVVPPSFRITNITNAYLIFFLDTEGVHGRSRLILDMLGSEIVYL